ncbi:hypothetical protein KSC_017020 [Ktedonobacter sp. SOSP1-52]|nr:hypothetical protein KSC_017020 [Ktedonobacter sp. SOSP1-52]
MSVCVKHAISHRFLCVFLEEDDERGVFARAGGGRGIASPLKREEKVLTTLTGEHF